MKNLQMEYRAAKDNKGKTGRGRKIFNFWMRCWTINHPPDQATSPLRHLCTTGPEWGERGGREIYTKKGAVTMKMGNEANLRRRCPNRFNFVCVNWAKEMVSNDLVYRVKIPICIYARAALKENTTDTFQTSGRDSLQEEPAVCTHSDACGPMPSERTGGRYTSLSLLMTTHNVAVFISCNTYRKC